VTDLPDPAPAASPPPDPGASPPDLGRAGRAPVLAAILSAIVPGAGQAYERRFAAAALFLLPVAVLALAAGVAVGASSLPALAGSLLAPGALTSILVLDVALLAWRILAVVDAWRGARPTTGASVAVGVEGAVNADDGATTGRPAGMRAAPRHRARTALGVVALVAILVFVSVPHAVAGWYATAASTAVGEIFTEADSDPLAGLGAGESPGSTLPGDAAAIATAAPTTTPTATIAPTPPPTPLGSYGPAALPPTPTPQPTPTPPPTPEPLMSRVNVLLLGIDSGPGRNQALTDTMIVVSLDPVGNTVSMMSIPRDTVNAPLGDGAAYQPKLNSLLAYATRNPGAFPGRKPIRVLKDTIGEMVGQTIDYYASADLPGFIKVVDAIGGVGVYVKEALADYRYKEYGFRGFFIDAGCHHMDGKTALAYARIRYSVGQNDFTRASRQQQVLVAARDQVVRKGLLLDIPALFGALGKTIRTDLPQDLAPRLAEFAAGIDARDVTQAVVQPPLVGYGHNAYGSVLIPDLAAIRAVADGLFSATGTKPVGWPPPANPTPTPDPAQAKAPRPTPLACK
jgi:LCP family protein required for cell wall assembly